MTLSPPSLNDRDLFDFDGDTYVADKDQERLSGQLGRVFGLMRDGKWRTLSEITDKTGDASDAAISARLRDLRKERFGGHDVERRRRNGQGLFEYRVRVSAGVSE